MRIEPFSAWRFRTDVTGDPALCVSPPFDHLTPELIAQLEARSPYNIARLVKPPSGGGPDHSGAHYRQARTVLKKWISAGAMAPDAIAGIYPYSQTYSVGSDRVTRHGFIALGDLRDAGLFTHEETHTHVREDRSRLRLATAADFGLVFTIYSDPAQSIDRLLRDCEMGTPLVVTDQPDGSTHRLYRCTDRETTKRIQRHMASLDCVIADGHHRTAAAFDAWKESGNDAWAFIMMAFFNADAPGMMLRPVHRAVSVRRRWQFGDFLEVLADNFKLQELPIEGLEAADLAARLEGLVRERRREDRVAFGMVGTDPETAYIAEVRPDCVANWPWPTDTEPVFRQLATATFETGILRAALGFTDADIAEGRRLAFCKDAATVVELVRRGECQLGFILPPIPLSAVFEVAKHRQNLPQKSTYFFPKLLTGLVVNRIEAAASV